MKRLFPLLFLLMVFMPTHAQSNAEWTIMLYGAMDNDLEKYIFADLQEIQMVGSTAGVNLIAQIDRNVDYETRWGDWSDTRRFYLPHKDVPTYTDDQKIELMVQYFVNQGMGTADSIRQEIVEIFNVDRVLFDRIFSANLIDVDFDLDPVEIIGEADMGDPQTLQDFVAWGITNYPANRYMLIISSHGSGWAGLGPDYDSGQSMLEIGEIQAGVRAALDATGVDKLDIIGFDACLMSQYEVATALESVAHYSLAAEEVIPGQGWQYTPPLQALTANPSMDARAFGQVVIDAYVSGYVAQNTAKVDLHLLDLSQMGQVSAALAEFDRVIGSDVLLSLSALASARQSAQTFGIDPSSGDNGLFSFIDLQDFMQRLYIQSFDRPELVAAIDTVLLAVSNSVAYTSADEYLPGAQGMSIYFPLNTQMYNLFGGQRGYAFASSGAQLWSGLLDEVHDTINTQLDASALTVQITSAPETGSLYDPPTLVFDYDGVGINSIKAVVLLRLNNGSEVILSESHIARSLSVEFAGETYDYIDLTPRDSNNFIWNAKFSVLTNGTESVPVLLSPRGLGEALIWGVLLDRDFNVINSAVLIYNGSTQEVTTIIAFAENGAPFQMQPDPGTYFMPTWDTLSPTGELTTEFSQVAFDVSFGLPQVEFIAAPDGMYRVGFEVRDLADHAVFDAANVTIVNSGLDPNWQAYKSLDQGMTFLYPSSWSDPQGFLREDGSFAVVLYDPQNEASQLAMVVHQGRTFDDVFAETYQRAADLENVTLYDVQDLTDLPFSPRGFEYEFTLNGVRMAGIRLVYSIQETNRVYVVNLIVPMEQYEFATEMLMNLVSTISFLRE